MAYRSSAGDVFRACVSGIRTGQLITRVSQSDKEFHFQNWFADRLRESGFAFEKLGRNSYPDFVLVRYPEGYEVKGLAYPGREATYDCNSQVPTGFHNERQIFYVFGRYPPQPDGDEYPVLDLVVCHGSFLNASHGYVHKNRHVRGFGSYGDILIRDRKMYVAQTPFALTRGTAHSQTLILPAEYSVDEEFETVGELVRREVDQVLVGYRFDLRDNGLVAETVPNPYAGREWLFRAHRLVGSPGAGVTMVDGT